MLVASIVMARTAPHYRLGWFWFATTVVYATCFSSVALFVLHQYSGRGLHVCRVRVLRDLWTGARFVMSRNDLIGVTRIGRWYYVLAPLNADTCWSARAARYHVVARRYRLRTRSRGRALIHAHNIQRHSVPTEYGVWEL